jgi:DNA-binding transcriptional LysR family regulator
VELRHLRYFVTVADFLHFGRAAQSLGIAQPSLSHQILQLETELQTKLFERRKKRVQLTESGTRFLEETRQILEHVDRAALIARSGRGPDQERLRLGFGYWTDVMKVCDAIKRFNESHPTVHVELHSMNVPEQFAALRDGRIDIGFVRPPITDSTINTELFLNEPFMIGVPTKHRLAREKRVPICELKEERMIMAPREKIPFFYDLTLRLFQDAGFVPKVHYEVDYPTMVMGLVAMGVGITVVPESVRKIQFSGITFVPLQPSSRILETVLAWRKDDLPSALPDFLQVLRDVAGSQRSQSPRRLAKRVRKL